MAGWLVVWSRDGSPIDPGRWDRAIRAAEQYGERVTSHKNDSIRTAVWRRETGEFPHNGTSHAPRAACRVAWVGQCLSDFGEVTQECIHAIADKTVPDQTVAGFNGAFAAAVVHDAPSCVTLWTDRHRHYPVYLHRGKQWWAASTEMRCVVPWLERPKLNLNAVDLFMRCGELIDRMTPLEEIEVLPGGVRLCDRGGEVEEHRYWRFEFKIAPSQRFDACARDLGKRLKTALRRVEAARLRLAVPLSGGLDSRLLLGLCENPCRIPSFTWGTADCRDVRFADEFARRIGSPHQVHVWRPADFLPHWAEGADRTAGGMGVHEMFMAPFVRLLADHGDAVLNGLAGDALLGGNFLKRSWLRERSIRALAHQTWRWRVTPEQDNLTTRLLRRDAMPSSARELWTASIVAHRDGRPIEVLNEWLFENRVFRFTNCGTMLLRGGIESYAPFFDRDFVDAILRVPLEYRLKHRLYLEVLQRSCPAASVVRWQRTCLPPSWGYAANLTSLALHRGMRMLGTVLGFDPFPRAAVAHVDQWFRAEWRSAAEAVLLSERTLNRGIINPDALRSVWRGHLEGRDFIRTLGCLIGVELFARLFIDGDSIEPAF